MQIKTTLNYHFWIVNWSRILKIKIIGFWLKEVAERPTLILLVGV